MAVDRPHTWDYRFIEWPLPVRHIGGRMRFEPVAGGTMMHWETTYELGSAPIWRLLSPLVSLGSLAFLKSASLVLAGMARRAAL